MQLRARHDLFCLVGLLSICAAGALHRGAAPAEVPAPTRPAEVSVAAPLAAPPAAQPALPAQHPRFLGRDPFARPMCPMDNPATAGLVLQGLEQDRASRHHS